MSWTNKAVLAWGWILTPEEIATLSDEVYEEWLDNEWLISSEIVDEKIFSYFSVDADESPKNVTDVTELVSEIGNEEFEKRVERELSHASDEYTREKLLFASRSNANVVTVDSQGRISVNATILKYSCLEKTGLFVGMGDHVQIWNP